MTGKERIGKEHKETEGEERNGTKMKIMRGKAGKQGKVRT